ncbi:helix-turn-helix domain-containing protein [Salinicoccus sesuvii]|uniref:Helix-turn-helix domain-containing protein n=1 Tax=Salinicoccus sesuvii TaxID=868281 RepID=A0ABV7N9V4_9STAP
MVGDKLVELRKAKRKTQQEMADILGVVKGTYSSYEQNRRTPDSEMQIKIADYFGITLDELNGREYSRNDPFEDADALMFSDKEGFDNLSEEDKQELKDMLNDQLEYWINKKNKK